MQLDPAEVKRWLAECKRIWPAACEIGRWLDEVFDPPWPHDIRRGLDDLGRTIWSVPDYDNGRSRSLAVDREVLRDVASRAIVGALEGTGWRRRIEEEDLLVRKAGPGALEVAAWDAPQFEKWFWSQRHKEWFVAFQSGSDGVSWGVGPLPIRHFVAIHGKTHAALGPDGKHDIASLEFAAIESWLPKRDHG